MMRRHVGSAAYSGLLAGLVGAAAMSVLAMFAAALVGKGWYAPLELVGGLATGSTARFDAGLQLMTALAGAVLHFTIGAAWGVLYGLLVETVMEQVNSREGLWLGAFFGILVWVIDLHTLMPRIDPAAARAIPLWFGALTHIGYGAIVGVLYPRFRTQPEPPHIRERTT